MPSVGGPAVVFVSIPPFTTLILGFDPRTALAVARSLHRQRIPVVIGLVAEWETPLRSRAIQGFVKLPGPFQCPAEFLRKLLATIETHRIDTIIPITDRALLCLAPHDEALRSRVRIAGPTSAQVSLVLDKLATAELAATLGIPVPFSQVVETEQDLEALRDKIRYPVFVKSRDKSTSCRNLESSGLDAHYCENFAVLREFAKNVAPKASLLVQKHCPGDDVGLAVLMHKGEVLRKFQYRARKLLPAEGGVCVLACSEAVDTRLADCATRILQALNWEGVAQLDFRHDSLTGEFALLEINGRFWGSTSVAISAGIDLPFQAWQLAHAQAIPAMAKPYRVGLLARWLEGDLRRLLDLCLRPEAKRNGRPVIREFFRFLADFRPGVRGMFWSWRDPLAGFDTFKHSGVCWLETRWKQIFSSNVHDVEEIDDDVKAPLV